VLPQRLEVGRNRFLDTEATLSVAHRRSRELPPGSLRGPACPPSPKRARAHRPPDGGLPPVSHRNGPPMQDTQRESDDVSLGVRFLSAYQPRRSLCRFASPTPSALRVSHSLSDFSPPEPRGFVSRHIRP
jgi:hypothetical protein